MVATVHKVEVGIHIGQRPAARGRRRGDLLARMRTQLHWGTSKEEALCARLPPFCPAYCAAVSRQVPLQGFLAHGASTQLREHERCRLPSHELAISALWLAGRIADEFQPHRHRPNALAVACSTRIPHNLPFHSPTHPATTQHQRTHLTPPKSHATHLMRQLSI